MWQRVAAGEEGSGYVLLDSVGYLLQGIYTYVNICAYHITWCMCTYMYMYTPAKRDQLFKVGACTHAQRQITDYCIIPKLIITT